MNEVVKQDQQGISQETRAIMDLIQQIALNPQADVEKMRAAMEMKMQIFNRGAEVEYNAAMARVQAEIEPVRRTARNNQTNSNYAELDRIIQKCSPVWTGHGFALSFGSADCPKDGYYRVTCVCSHSAGHSVKYQADLPEDVAGIAGKTNKTGVHGFGSTMSYGRRYLTCMIFNIALTNEDNDGNSKKPPTDKPKQKIKQAITDARLDAAIAKIKSGEYTTAKLFEAFTLTDEQYDKLMDQIPEEGAAR